MHRGSRIIPRRARAGIAALLVNFETTALPAHLRMPIAQASNARTSTRMYGVPPMTTHSLLLLPGDGIGPEVMAEVERMVAFFNKKGKVTFKTDTALVGGCSIDKHGTPLTDE